MINILGVSYENGTRLIKHFLESMDKLPENANLPGEESLPEKEDVEDAPSESDPKNNEATTQDKAAAKGEVAP